MIVLNDSIKDSIYKELVKYAFNKCDVVMFVSKKVGFDNSDITALKKSMSKLENKFKNDYIFQVQRPNWVFSEVVNDNVDISNEEFNSLFNIYFFKFSDELKNYLLSNCDLYKWLNPEYPEDIAFFKDGICWLYSVAHERLCDIYVDNEKEYNYLKKIGLEFLDENYREKFKEEIYIEKLLVGND